MSFSISGDIKERLMLALFAVILITLGVALMPTVSSASYDAYVQASNTGLNCTPVGPDQCANYTLHTIVALFWGFVPFGYGLAIAGSVLFTLLKAIKG